LGVHVWVTQTLFVHTAFVPHVPHASEPPQPSGIDPQFFPCAAQVVGVQVPPVWQLPLVHVSPVGQVQVIVPPHPSATEPHALPTPPDPQPLGTHVGWHVPLLVALHVSPEVQAHESVPPQPSGIVPQVSPVLPAGHALTVQPHWLAVPPPPHVCGEAHVPQLTVPPCPSEIVPQFAFAARQRAGPPPPTEHASGLAGGVVM
jgi:hypothetical protein